jgi:hypothetical protein
MVNYGGSTAALKPWQFYVGATAYGAAGNGKVITDAAMTATGNTLTSASQAQFTSADVGKSVVVETANGAYVHGSGTITGYISPTQVTVSFTASSTTGGTPGAIAYYGTDDTAAIQAAITAATAYAVANQGYAQILFDAVMYVLGGPFNHAGTGNSQLLLPTIAVTAPQVTLEFTGFPDTVNLMWFQQDTPMVMGTCLASTRIDGTATGGGSNGPASVLGGPVNGFGGEPGAFSNCHVIIRGLQVMVPYNVIASGVDLFGMVTHDVASLRVFAAAVVPTSTAPVPSLATPNNIANSVSMGLGASVAGNQTQCRVSQFSCEGLLYGFSPSEWTYAENIHCMYDQVAIGPRAGNGVAMVHAALLVDVQAENCNTAVAPNGTGTMRIDILDLQTESIASSALVFDTTSQLQGTFHLRAQGSAGNYTANGWLSGGSGGALLRIVNELTTPGPVSAPHAVAASGSPWFNGYTRDAFITMAATTITVMTITGPNGVTVTQAIPTGATTYQVVVPPNGSYTATYTGTLTHNVTLI